MKLKTFIFGLIAFSFIATLFAQQPPQNGNQYGAVTLESLDANGLIRLNGTSITGNLRLTGSLISKSGEIGTIDVVGEANFTDSTIKNGGSIMGSLQAVRSKFQKPITILTQKAVFTSSQLEGITVLRDGAFKGKQIIELKQGTVINGPIHFESGKGEVIIFPGCQALGPVSGGKIVKKS